MRFFEPGLCSVTFRSLSPQAVIELAAANGIRSIEWGADIHVPPGDLENARDVAARTAQAGLSVSSYGSYIFAPDFAPEDVTAVLETAKALGTGHIRIWPGSRKRPSADYSPENAARQRKRWRQSPAGRTTMASQSASNITPTP